jgi:molybdopterin synthase sulfur carrier subunit
MRVLIPSPLQSYTGGQRLVDAEGPTLGGLLLDLDHRYPGIRFRMIDEQDQVRPHMTIYVRGERTRVLETSLTGCEEVVILQALSGG